MVSNSPSQKADKFLLRLPDGIRQLVAREAEANNRTMTKEMVLRLQRSFEFDYTSLPYEVVQAVEAEMAKKGVTQESALIGLVLAGQSAGGTVVNLKIAPGTTAKDVRDALTEALKHLPDDAHVVTVKL